QGQRELDQDPVDALIGVEIGDDLEKLGLGNRVGKVVGEAGHAGLGRRAVLRAHVNRACRILSHQHGRETGGASDPLLEVANLVGDFLADRGGRGFAVDPPCGHTVPVMRLVSAPVRSLCAIAIRMMTIRGEKSIPPKSGSMRRIGRYIGSVIRLIAFTDARTPGEWMLSTLNTISQLITNWTTTMNHRMFSRRWAMSNRAPVIAAA